MKKYKASSIKKLAPHITQEKAVTTKVKTGPFRTKVKTAKTTKTTDYKKQKLDAKGTMTKTVYKANGGVKTKSKNLSSRKIINKGY